MNDSIHQYNIIMLANDENDKARKLYFWGSIFIMLLLLVCLSIYFIKWKQKSINIIGVLSILLINQFLYSVFETIGIVGQTDNLVCITSLIGRLFFTIAAQFWVIFITRLIYRQALAPGKFFNIVKFFYRNILITYAPSSIFSIFMLIMVMVNQSSSEKQCWRIIKNQQTLDVVIFFTSFILPKLICFILISGYLFQYQKRIKKWTIYLLFPIVSLTFSIYYLPVKMYIFLDSQTTISYILEMALLIEPVIFGVLFMYMGNKYNSSQKFVSSELTIGDSDPEINLIDDL